MPVVDISLNNPVPVALANELEKHLFFVANEIVAFALIYSDEQIRGIKVTLAATEPNTLAAKINELVDDVILKQKNIPAKVVWRSAASPGLEPETNLFNLLVEKEMLFEAGEGQVGLGEPLISLMDYFDRRVKQIALGFSNAREYRYPTLLPTHVLEQFDYFASFPQFVMFVTRLHNDLDVYRAFMSEYADQARITSSIFSYCQDHAYCLPPTMCYHTYHQHRGQHLAEDRVVTARGKSFRFESRYHRGLERLWDFTIREVVFLGSWAFVAACRQDFMQQAFQLMDELGLSGYCEVANDPFFVNPQAAGKIFSQRLMELKYELRLHIGAAPSLAVASFNFHERFFGECFEITHATHQPIVTGCVGFGLERLLYAFLCQHGLEEQHWPATVRKALGYLS